MFSRRHPRTRWQKIRESLWPTMGFYRLVIYYQHRMGRLKETPYAVAAGFASGVAIAFTPFLGFHLMLGGLLAWLVGGSLIAMVVGSVVAGNFWTYPFIFVGSFKLGKFLLGQTPRLHKEHIPFSWALLLHKPTEYLLPMLLGSLPFAVVSWIAAFYIVRRLMTGYQEARRIRCIKEKMILGVGTDIASIDRIEKTLKKQGARFLARCFAKERDHVEAAAKGDIKRRAAGYAKRWAAKEACAKALGLGIREDISLKSIVVGNNTKGAPSLVLSGGAKERLTHLTPKGMTAEVHVSLSDEPPLALAFVVISAK